MAVYAYYRMRRRERAPEEDRVAFADSVRIAQTVSTVDPLPHEQSEAPTEPGPKEPVETAGGVESNESAVGSSERLSQ